MGARVVTTLSSFSILSNVRASTRSYLKQFPTKNQAAEICLRSLQTSLCVVSSGFVHLEPWPNFATVVAMVRHSCRAPVSENCRQTKRSRKRHIRPSLPLLLTTTTMTYHSKCGYLTCYASLSCWFFALRRFLTISLTTSRFCGGLGRGLHDGQS